MKWSDVVRARGGGSIRLNGKLFVDKLLAERKRALEDDSTRVNRSRRKTEGEHTCSSALSPQEGKRRISRQLIPVCVSTLLWSVCVCVCMQGVLEHSACSCCLNVLVFFHR